jgi:hypothetical protein
MVATVAMGLLLLHRGRCGCCSLLKTKRARRRIREKLEAEAVNGLLLLLLW